MQPEEEVEKKRALFNETMTSMTISQKKKADGKKIGKSWGTKETINNIRKYVKNHRSLSCTYISGFSVFPLVFSSSLRQSSVLGRK